MLSPLLPLQALEIRSLSLAPPGARRAPPGPHLLLSALGLSLDDGGRALGCTRARARSGRGEGIAPAPRVLTQPFLDHPQEPRLWLGEGRGRLHQNCSWEPTFRGYLPDLVSPNTQFLFLSGAASLLSAAFPGQGSPGSGQRFSRGRNSFETWLSTLVKYQEWAEFTIQFQAVR